jgi:Rod binding domain-containing protein
MDAANASLFGAQTGQQMALAHAMATTASGVSDADKAKMRAKAQDFEAFYITQFVELISPDNKSSVMNGGAGEEMFRHNLNEELGKNIAQHGGFGIADKVYAELLKAQEAAATRAAITAQ